MCGHTTGVPVALQLFQQIASREETRLDARPITVHQATDQIGVQRMYDILVSLRLQRNQFAEGIARRRLRPDDPIAQRTDAPLQGSVRRMIIRGNGCLSGRSTTTG